VHILPTGVESIGYLAIGHVVHQNLLFGVSPPNIGSSFIAMANAQA
jgi:hypothetical protein